MNRRVYANSIDAFVPQFWANESIAILEEQMVYGNLVYRDFSPTLANYGETVNTRKPGEFTAVRKTDSDEVTDQDVSATNVPVTLNQWVHVSFIIKDGERSKAFKDLVDFYLRPAMLANARLLDQVIAGQVYQFRSNTAGALGSLSSSTALAYLVETREKMNRNKAYEDGRNLVLTPGSESEILKTELLTRADAVQDGGAALQRAYLGQRFGFNFFMNINTPEVSGGSQDSATTTAATVAAGATTVSATASVAQGQFFTLAGDMTPLRCSAVSGSGPYSVTTTLPVRDAVASGAALKLYTQGAVDLAAGYLSGHVKAIHVDGGAVPKVGQMVAFNDTVGTAIRTPIYSIVRVVNTAGSDYDIYLDRPLETDLANDDVVSYGPDGSYNFAFHRNAVALVNRPLELPIEGTGARSALASYNGLSMRAVITYDGKAQGHRVVLDSLFGVKVLDTGLGCVMLG